ncbi:MAG: TldD/PmbA family protein, partial [Chloroflexi bacterium]|nr:TldD/PmbA family protein [Chloroflexota bacterium]
MRWLTDRALNTAQVLGASYADVRVVRRQDQIVVVKNGKVEALTLERDEGFGVRVLLEGAWGFASSSRLDTAEADRIAGQAVASARASSRVRGEPVDLGIPMPAFAAYRTPIAKDPFAVPIEEKIALLLAADRGMASVKGVTLTESSLEARREVKVFASTEGSYIEQEIIETGGGIEATAVAEGELQTRSYPNSFGRHQGTMGWELVERMDLVGNGGRIAEETVRLLTAKPCPADITTTVILDATQLALQIHESCG